MTHRLRVVRAVDPHVPVDTDGWSLPDLASLRAYLEVQPDLGVPSLYYVDHVGDHGERMGPADYAALRNAWARYRARR